LKKRRGLPNLDPGIVLGAVDAGVWPTVGVIFFHFPAEKNSGLRERGRCEPLQTGDDDNRLFARRAQNIDKRNEGEGGGEEERAGRGKMIRMQIKRSSTKRRGRMRRRRWKQGEGGRREEEKRKVQRGQP
jgi:hypothetical protein